MSASTDVVQSIAACRGKLASRGRGNVVLVPTMGALHEGHATLLRKARKLAGRGGRVVVSIFVNPTQFLPGEDLDAYPRPWRKDLAMCRELGVDLVFRPSADAMYPGDRSVQVVERALSRGLCGASRPGHFDGVCTVVAKLFHIVQPDEAVFGEKDFQQLAVIRRMVRDLDFPVRIRPVPTVREADGLAASSRNRYLSEAERVQAGCLYRSLRMTRKAWRGGVRDRCELLETLRCGVEEVPLARVDYAEIVDPESLEPWMPSMPRARALLAARVGGTRLIDNMALS